MDGGSWKKWNEGLQIGGMPRPGEGVGPPRQKRPPLRLRAPFKPTSGRAGARESRSAPPPPPAGAVQHLSGRHGLGTRTDPHTPAGLVIAHTYIHTPANTGSENPCFPPTAPLLGLERAGHPLPSAPCKVSFQLRAEVGRDTRHPGGRGPGRWGLPPFRKKAGGPGTPFEGFRPASGLGVWGEVYLGRGFPGRSGGWGGVAPWLWNWSCLAPIKQGPRRPCSQSWGQSARSFPSAQSFF